MEGSRQKLDAILERARHILDEAHRSDQEKIERAFGKTVDELRRSPDFLADTLESGVDNQRLLALNVLVFFTPSPDGLNRRLIHSVMDIARNGDNEAELRMIGLAALDDLYQATGEQSILQFFARFALDYAENSRCRALSYLYTMPIFDRMKGLLVSESDVSIETFDEERLRRLAQSQNVD